MATTLPPEIVDLQDYTESTNIMVHSDTGAGKTILAAELPDTLIIAAEEGTISAKRWGHASKVWRVHNWEEWTEAAAWIEENQDAFKWIIIDSITKLQSWCIRWIMQQVVANNATRDPHIPSQGDHFKWQLMMKEMVEDINEWDVNVCWLAQSMKREDEDGNEIVLPLIEGKDYQISAWVCAQMHCIFYLRKVAPKEKGGRPRRYLYTDHARFYSKDRYGIFKPTIASPSLADMMQQVEDSEDVNPAARTPRKVAGSRREQVVNSAKKSTAKKTTKKTARKRTTKRS